MLARALSALLLFSFACGDDDEPTDDAGVSTDTSTDDTGTDADLEDAGEDAAELDAETPDAPMPDVGDDLAAMFCRADIARDEMCGDTPADLAECVSEQQCTLNVMLRPDAAAAVTGCISSLECSEGDDSCYSSAGLGVAASEGAAEYTNACSMRREECGAPFSDDFCFFDIAADGVYAMLEACFAEECDAVAGCLLGVLTCDT